MARDRDDDRRRDDDRDDDRRRDRDDDRDDDRRRSRDRDDDYDDSEPRRKSSGGDGAAGFGIAGMVLGIVSLVVSFIPCFGMYGFFPGLVALILSGIGMSKAKSKGMSIAGLVVSILAVGIASYWYFAVKEVVKKTDDVITNVKDAQNQFNKDFNKPKFPFKD